VEWLCLGSTKLCTKKIGAFAQNNTTPHPKRHTAWCSSLPPPPPPLRLLRSSALKFPHLSSYDAWPKTGDVGLAF
jgi:hypothetical protein